MLEQNKQKSRSWAFENCKGHSNKTRTINRYARHIAVVLHDVRPNV